MQLHLPLFPKDAQLINDNVGVYEKDSLVQHIFNVAPIYSHAKDDINAFRFITSNFIHENLCRKVDIEKSFGVSTFGLTELKRGVISPISLLLTGT